MSAYGEVGVSVVIATTSPDVASPPQAGGRHGAVIGPDAHDAAYSPARYLLALSVNTDPDRMYLRTIASDRWPVVLMIDRSGAPAAAAEVARP